MWQIKGSCNDQWKINFMNELIDDVHQTAESGLSHKEANDILWFLNYNNNNNNNKVAESKTLAVYCCHEGALSKLALLSIVDTNVPFILSHLLAPFLIQLGLLDYTFLQERCSWNWQEKGNSSQLSL